MFSGFCTTRPWSCPFCERVDERLAGVEADEGDLAGPVDVLQRQQRAGVDDSLTQKMPWRSRPKRFSRFSAARFAVSRVGPAY